MKALLRADQEVTVTLVLKEVQARRKLDTLLERSPVDGHASNGAMVRASRTLGELLRTTKHATEPEADRIQSTPTRSAGWCDFCWLHCRFIVRPDVRTPHAVLRFHSCRGGLGFLGEVVWARVPGMRLLRVKFDVDWLQLVYPGKTENSHEHFCVDNHGVRTCRTTRRHLETAR